MVAAVMMMVVCDHAATHVPSGERCSGECDCGEGRDEFDLVHGMVPSLSRKPILALTQRQDDPPEVSDKRFRGRHAWRFARPRNAAHLTRGYAA